MTDGPLSGRSILVGVAGSIAAFRAADLVSRLWKDGARVTVLMTRAATAFVAPLTFRTLSHRSVIVDLLADGDADDPEHVALARDAACFSIAPATANILAKLAQGIADDAITTTALVTRCPLVIAPAMNDRMWEHPAVQGNLAILRKRGAIVVEPETGRLACGSWGQGRLSPVDRIYDAIVRSLPKAKASPAPRLRAKRRRG